MVAQVCLFREGGTEYLRALDFNMEDSAPSPDLLQDPTTIPLHECRSSEQIEAATDIIQQRPSQLYNALHDRAKLLGNGAQFEAALRDAAAMQRIRPTVALGYLCEGDIYCQQGRVEDAVAIYNKGLEAVPASEPHYHDLQQQQQQQQQRIATAAAKTNTSSSNKRIDFISELPIDVVSTNIIPRFMPVLLSTGCCPYLYVSHTWHQRIIQHGLSIEVDYEAPSFREGHEQLIRFTPYVKSLDLIVRKEKHLVNLLSRAKFSSLKRLKLASETPESQLKGLAMVADTLTHLDLGYNSSLHLRDIMQTCPNLTFLRFHDVNAVIPSSIGSLQYPRLAHLGIHSYSPENVEKDNLVRVLSLFPNLVSFEMSPMPEDSSILLLLTQQCPHLRTLFYGREMEEKDTKPIIHAKEKGITVARLGQDDMFDPDGLITFLSQHHQTLKELDLDIDIEDEDDGHSSWGLKDGNLIRHGKVVPMSFPNLQTLRIAGDDYSSTPCLPWILENAPQLESITVPESRFTRDTTQGLKQLKHLKKLHVNDVFGKVKDAAIGPLLQHHAALGDRSTLVHIQVTFDTDQLSDVAWLPLMCGLKQLKKLDLFADRMRRDCIPFLAKLSIGCPALDDLMLGYPSTHLEDGLIEVLCPHPNLRSLYIGDHLEDEDLFCLANFPKLERVYLCFPPPDYIVDSLPKRIQLIY
ncbi:hypothetical protein O0I10_006728 [Lichtheimia ornata]|uniref:Uncharacterized protein n=1 Tax=Lichtheimia ornata TaxID=688661 RepID=A0AAD7V3X1_9FUNG|nr:uncharacterized protein O0I10_006728 [Lichtheimia ornata]KAJ8657662.1 hypothetical protein O0I10_006728 [Lichtheimia ornata]